MDSVGALIPITTSAQADPLLIPNTSGSLRIFADSTTNQISTTDSFGNLGAIGNVLVKEVQIPSAQVLTLYTTPIVLVPAVVGKAIIPQQVLGILNFNTTQYNGNGDLQVSLLTTTKELFQENANNFLFANSYTSGFFEPKYLSVNLEQTAGDSDLILS